MPMTDCLSRSDSEAAKRKLAASRRHRQHTEGDDRTMAIVERRLAHHGLRHAVANPDLPENRHQRRRIGRGQSRAEQQRDDQGHAEDIVGGNVR